MWRRQAVAVLAVRDCTGGGGLQSNVWALHVLLQCGFASDGMRQSGLLTATGKAGLQTVCNL